MGNALNLTTTTVSIESRVNAVALSPAAIQKEPSRGVNYGTVPSDGHNTALREARGPSDMGGVLEGFVRGSSKTVSAMGRRMVELRPTPAVWPETSANPTLNSEPSGFSMTNTMM